MVARGEAVGETLLWGVTELCRMISMSMPMGQQMLGAPPLVVARRSTKRYIREYVVQHELYRTTCEREGREDEALGVYYRVDDAVMDAVCCRAFRGRSSMDGIT